MAYDDISWECMSHEIFGKAVYTELNIDLQKAVMDVFYDVTEKNLRVCAFLYGVTRSSVGSWELFDRYKPAPFNEGVPREKQVWAKPPIVFELAYGDHVHVLGDLLPVEVASKGPRKQVQVLPPFHFGGVVLGWAPSEKHKRRWALLRSPSLQLEPQSLTLDPQPATLGSFITHSLRLSVVSQVCGWRLLSRSIHQPQHFSRQWVCEA